MTTPTLVLLPGMDGAGVLFEPFVAALDNHLATCIVAYPQDEPLGYEALVERTQALLPRDGPLVILGESFSGPIAVLLASHHVERVRGLILCSSFVRNPRPGWSWVAPIVRRVPVPVPPTRIVARALFGRRVTAQLTALLDDSLVGVRGDVLRTRLLAVGSVDVSSSLAALKLPLLYLQAREDRLVPATALKTIARLRPDVQWKTLDSAHAVLQVCPGEAARAVRSFVAGLPA